MTKLAQLSHTVQTLFTETAHRHARRDGFVQRQRCLTGPVFVETLVFGWLDNPQASLTQLSQTAAALGAPISPQALDARFTPQAAALLASVLAEATQHLIRAQGVAIELLERFTGVFVVDTSTISLPAALQADWPGCGGQTPEAGAAALKLEVQLDLRTGQLSGPYPMPARRHDQRGQLAACALPRGALRLSDLGYFSLDRFEAMQQAGQYWLSRLKTGTVVYDVQEAHAGRLDLDRVLVELARSGRTQVELPIRLGATHRLPGRLLLARVPEAVAAARRRKLRRAAAKHGRQPSQRRLARCAWTLLVTNCPAARLSFAEAFALARARWQIELLFKRWKQHGGLSRSRSRKPWRVLCEVYAKLLAMLVTHWIVRVGLWSRAEKSLVQGAQVVSAHALILAVSLSSWACLRRTLARVVRVLEAGCRMNARRKHPNTYQRLLNPGICALT